MAPGTVPRDDLERHATPKKGIVWKPGQDPGRGGALVGDILWRGQEQRRCRGAASTSATNALPTALVTLNPIAELRASADRRYRRYP